ncbi:hypothetical protein ALC62_00232, partial [Cyphomyrmex costatus]
NHMSRLLAHERNASASALLDALVADHNEDHDEDYDEKVSKVGACPIIWLFSDSPNA